MSNRTDALWRLLGLPVLIIIVPILLVVGVVAALLWMVADVVMQLATGRQGLTAGSGGAWGWLSRLYYWPMNMAEWILFGTGEFPMMP